MAKLDIDHDCYKSIGKNALNYQTKLANQSTAIKKIIEETKEVWNGKNSNKAVEYFQNSADLFKNMANMIEPYIKEYKKLTVALRNIYGELD